MGLKLSRGWAEGGVIVRNSGQKHYQFEPNDMQ